jgi:hypothetical protein
LHSRLVARRSPACYRLNSPATQNRSDNSWSIRRLGDRDALAVVRLVVDGGGFTGIDTADVSGAGGIGAIKVAGASSGAPSATLVTTRNNSLIFAVGNDWNHAIARTPGADQVLVHQYLAPVDDTYWVQRVVPAIPVAGTSVALGDVAPTSDRWNLAVVEIVPR